MKYRRSPLYLYFWNRKGRSCRAAYCPFVSQAKSSWLLLFLKGADTSSDQKERKVPFCCSWRQSRYSRRRISRLSSRRLLYWQCSCSSCYWSHKTSSRGVPAIAISFINNLWNSLVSIHCSSIGQSRVGGDINMERSKWRDAHLLFF